MMIRPVPPCVRAGFDFAANATCVVALRACPGDGSSLAVSGEGNSNLVVCVVSGLESY